MPFDCSPLVIEGANLIPLVWLVLLHLVHQWMTLRQVAHSFDIGVMLNSRSRARGCVEPCPQYMIACVVSHGVVKELKVGDKQPLLLQQHAVGVINLVGRPRFLFDLGGLGLVGARQRLRTNRVPLTPLAQEPQRCCVEAKADERGIAFADPGWMACSLPAAGWHGHQGVEGEVAAGCEMALEKRRWRGGGGWGLGMAAATASKLGGVGGCRGGLKDVFVYFTLFDAN